MKITQQIFDEVATHLIKQNDRSMFPNGGCAYRDDHGRKCAVGCMIDEDHYHEDLEGEDNLEPRVVLALHKSGVEDNEKNSILLSDLQRIHDEESVSSWVGKLYAIAKDYKLSDAVLTQLKH